MRFLPLMGVMMLFAVMIVSNNAAAVVEPISDIPANHNFVGIVVTELKYEPYPVNPGEYFNIWIKAQKGTGGVKNTEHVVFELMPEYPFSLDANEDARKDFGLIGSEPVVLQYKIRVDKSAVEGANELRLRYNVDGSENNWVIQKFGINVADAQTNFDIVVQDAANGQVSLAIANIGKNTANAAIARVPDQEGIRVSGTNGQMIGNLVAGDYTLVSFNLVQGNTGQRSNENITNQNPAGQFGERTVNIEIDYTDAIGERRSVIKGISLNGQALGVVNGTALRSGVSGGQRGAFTQQAASTSIFASVWFWIFILLIITSIYIIKKRPEMARSLFRKFRGKKSFQYQGLGEETPSWVTTERNKKRK